MKSLLESFGIQFDRPELLEEALRHSSYCNEAGGGLPSNERLEFLGDAVLGLAVAEWLVTRRPYWREGELTKARSSLVSQEALAKTAEELGISEHIRVGRAEDENGLQRLPSVLSDAFEAIVGAICVDAGYEKARDFVQEVLRTALEESLAVGPDAEDAKSRLQILTQEVHQALPVYHTVSEEGPEHRKAFTIGVSLHGRALATGTGYSKKEAEQQAAAAALEVLAHEEHAAKGAASDDGTGEGGR